MTCETASSELPFQPARYLHGAEKLSSILATTNTPKHPPHHRVGAIVGTCLGIAGAVLLVGLVLFWILLRHRHHAATVQAQDVVPRSWVSSDVLGCDRPVVVATNQPSRSLDLAGTDTDNASVFPGTEETVEMKLWNKSTDVLDISVENASPSPSPVPSSPSPLPGPIEPYVPRQIPQSAPDLSIHTNVPAAAPEPSSSSHECTPTGSSRSLIRPLPIPPTRSQMRRPRSAKAEEARRESRHRSRLSRSALSADDLQAYVHGDRRSRAHSISSISCEAGGCEMIVQHHDGGMDARIDLPPPYYECLQAQATLPSASRAHTLPVAWP